jgi:hypothetical protein
MALVDGDLGRTNLDSERHQCRPFWCQGFNVRWKLSFIEEDGLG